MKKEFLALSALGLSFTGTGWGGQPNSLVQEENRSACMNAVTGAHESGWGVEPNKTIVWEFIGVRGYTARRKYNLATGTSGLFTSKGYPEIIRISGPQPEPPSKIDGMKSCLGSFPVAGRQ